MEPLLRIGDVCWEETQHFSQWNEADSDLFGEKCCDMMIIYNCRKYQEQAQQATISEEIIFVMFRCTYFPCLKIITIFNSYNKVCKIRNNVYYLTSKSFLICAIKF